MNSSSPLRRPGFLALFFTQLSAVFNDNLFKSALLVWITTRGASLFGLSSATMLGLVSALFIAPFFLFSGTAGQLADRFEKGRIARWVKAAELAIMLLASVGLLRGSLPLMLASLVLLGVHSSVLGPVKYAVLPELVSSSELVQANAFVEMGTFLAILAGSVAGGLLVNGAGGPSALAVILLVSACLGLGASLALPATQPGDAALRVHLNPVTPSLSILRTLKQTRALFLSALGISWFWLLGVVMLSFLPSYVHDTLHANETVITFMLALFCVGIALGALLTEKISGKNLELGLVPVGSLGMTACLVDLFANDVAPLTGDSFGLAAFIAHPGCVRMSLDLFAMAMFGGFFTVPLYTLLQQRSDSQVRSRVIAGNNILNAAFMVLGSLLLALVQSLTLPPRTILLVLSLLSFATAVYLYTLLPEFLLRFMAMILSRVAYRVRVAGHEHLPEQGAAVLVCNHVAFNDWLIIAGSVRRPVRFVMDHNMAKLPLVSALLERGKVIPIAPAHEDQALMERAFERIAEELRAGEIVCIYPEGKITRTGELNPFKPGIERILRETAVPVIPMGLVGLWGSLFSRKDGPAMRKFPRRFRARLTLQIGDAIVPTEASAKVLEERVAQLMKQAEAS